MIKLIRTRIVRNARVVEGWKAMVPNSGYTGTGINIAEAIGDLVHSHPEKFGVRIEFDTAK